LQGPSVAATDKSITARQECEDVAESSTAKHADNAKVFDFWGVANALADSVKKTTADLSASGCRSDAAEA